MISTSTLRLHLLALAALTPVCALAQDGAAEGGYLYGGLSLGASQARIDQPRITAGLQASGLATTGFKSDERSVAGRIFGGWQMNRHFGLEASAFDLGKFSFQANTAPAGSLNGDIRLRGLGLDLVGTMPLTERLSLIGRIGVQSIQARDRFTGSGAVAVLNPNPSVRGTHEKFGLGLQYAFSPRFLVRAEGERYRVDDAVGNRGGVNVASVSLVFPIGRDEQRVRRTAAAPAYTPLPAPMPVPVVVAAAPPPPVPAPMPRAMEPARTRVSFSAESLFGFDQSSLQPAGRVALDTFANQTRGTRFDVVTVEGHTDRLGTPEYNQALSLRRAQVVKDYLVASGGIAAGQINAVGKGESEPLASTTPCAGTRPSARLIACLQADRRVEIEVSATR